MKYLKFSFIIAAALITSSCAKDIGESANAIQKRLLGAWIRVNYGNLTPTESGIYILDKNLGTGKAITDTSFVFLDYTVQTLEGDYTEYSSAEMAKMMGTYADTAHYAPAIWKRGSYTIYDGLDEIIVGLKQDGHVKAAIPPELMIISYPDDLKDIYTSISNAQTVTTNSIYDITIRNIVEDMEAYEKNLLKQYAEAHYPGLDTLSDGFYFKKTLELPDADSIVYDTNINVRYIGKLLDGYCFDTNIQDTAKFYRRAEGERDAFSVTFKDDVDEMASDNSIINGFAKTIRQMRYGEKAIAFFKSSMGYASSGSTNIPAYSPIFFEVWVEPKK